MSKKEKITPGWTAPPKTQEVTNLQNLVDQGADYKTPIRNAYARAQHQNARSYNNPLGGFTTADVRDKSIRSQNADFQQNMGIDLSNAAQSNADAKFGRQATVAGFTQPKDYIAERKTSDPWGTAVGFASAASNVAGGALKGSGK